MLRVGGLFTVHTILCYWHGVSGHAGSWFTRMRSNCQCQNDQLEELHDESRAHPPQTV